MRVLVVEDERFLADLVAEGLRERAMAVDVAYDGDGALERLAVNAYDVLVLDRDLPGVHGDDICRELARRGEPVRILMLTASGAVHERVDGLNLGADDYLAKPFAFDELVARVNALARRNAPPLPPVLEHGGITLDTARRQAFRDGRYLPLSRKEYAVLEVLMQARGTVVSTENLLERAWDENTDPFTTVVKVTMSKLRAKLGDPPVIVTVPGSGYRL
ncbi:response regulator transcription factor [Actinomadura madurae]|uniref:response regulator transcription factor n=1 Tax=Actinomadura madurae TaxID=1993 RepID=UPI00202613CA|nr:response regulator transcription factor [Actinomadura madurae]MCP9950088.1 response regulator transcription factor [Actinomadura madurae]MCP9966851.1 response regulator transcription factor [Actinomadura madurae]MCP9979335.1 response regulator transcription factor [Actinomadura madurae]MCQ0009141.1 response regulator transcription factor [Actinomadura madurae]MCQ0015536.1 response regulator transcription factor [Actinomadura madurae]